MSEWISVRMGENAEAFFEDFSLFLESGDGGVVQHLILHTSSDRSSLWSSTVLYSGSGTRMGGEKKEENIEPNSKKLKLFP